MAATKSFTIRLDPVPMAIPPRRFCIKRGGTQILPPLARIANTYRPTTMLNLARSHQLFNEHHGDARHRHDRSR
ncbi:hypothetical protein SPHINGOT1_270127 [Sphingomonas sp. T1]|nr:hypothetical protein SPHINGOT1_270127 [Sphingomonas sp. T1]